ncbi:MAG: type II toxin-antitoxin system RelE/ParE family toxin [Weissella confusa]|nr:type II toxin-antitoxin system RelE/ParE family toxin [Weissella confusa]
MQDEQENYKIVKLPSFADSLEEHIENWEDIGLSETQIRKHVSTIQKAVKSLSYWPTRFEDVTNMYGFVEETRRIPIGKTYAIFYRIKTEERAVIVGRIYDRRRLKVDF